MRKYESGMEWAFWRWTTKEAHITRLHLVKTPWFAVCLHWLNAPDPEPFLHDHPVSFLSIVLWGMYAESRNNIWKDVKERHWYNFIRATDKHAIIFVMPHTLTLALMGPKVRDWGFHTDKGWIYWRDYYNNKQQFIAREDRDENRL